MTLDDDVEALLFGYLESIGNVPYKQAVTKTTLEDLVRVCERYLSVMCLPSCLVARR